MATRTAFQFFDPVKFQQNLKTRQMGRYFSYRKSVPTTMDLAKRDISEGAPSGTLILAEAQTQGRGREARPWSSEMKGNLYFSLIVRLDSVKSALKLNLAVSIATVFALRHHHQNLSSPPSIKWPNDVWINGKKISGMLVDLQTITDNNNQQDNSLVAAVGVGINIFEDMHQSPSQEVRECATSLFNELGSTDNISREAILAEFCNQLEELLSLDHQAVMDIYKKHDLLTGNVVTVMPKKKEHVESYYTAKAIGFDDSGFLVVEKEDGSKHTLVAEEVTIRPANTTTNK